MGYRLSDPVVGNRPRYPLILVPLLFAAILITGLLVFDDYGIPYDDAIERTTTFANLKYILSTVAPNDPLPPALADQPDLLSWVDRYYGVAVQIPTAVLEWIFNFRFSPLSIYKIRHLWTFLQFFIGLIFFFRLLKLRCGSDRAALIGVLLLWLSPRIFANSFYNVKDLPFLSWILIAAYFLFKWIKNDSRTDLIVFAAIAAVVTNIRVIGGLLLLILIGIILERLVRRDLSFKRALLDGMLACGAYGAVWILITPLAWRQPISAMLGTIRQFSAYPHVSNELYFGRVTLNSELPWHYLPVWIGITSPIPVLFGFIGGAFSEISSLFRESRNGSQIKLISAREDVSALILATAPVGLAIVLGSSLYNGWRHFYFVYPWIVYFAVLFLERMFNSDRQSIYIAAWGAITVSLLVIAAWMIRFHPYQMVYFNALIPKSRRVLFEKDYWCVSCRDAVRPVIESDPNLRIVLSADGAFLTHTMNAFPASDRERIYLTDWSDDYSEKDYLFISFSRKPTGAFNFPAFEPVNRLTADGLPLHGVYRRVTNRLIPGEKISVQARTVAENAAVPQLTDWARETLWEFDETAQGEKAALRIEFSDLVSIDGITLRTVIQRNGLPDEVRISWSSDGEIYVPVKLTDSSYSEFFFEPVEARFLRIEGTEAGTSWKLSEVLVWDARAAEPIRSHEQGISFTD